jgi:hypothetical protein
MIAPNIVPHAAITITMGTTRAVECETKPGSAGRGPRIAPTNMEINRCLPIAEAIAFIAFIIV